MSTEAFGMLAVIAYSLAAVFAVVAVIVFFTQHIRQVHDDLTGRTAQRAIADLRSGSVSRSKFFEVADDSTSVAEQSRKGRDVLSGGDEVQPDSGSLKLRKVSKRKETRAARKSAQLGTAGTATASAQAGTAGAYAAKSGVAAGAAAGTAAAYRTANGAVAQGAGAASGAPTYGEAAEWVSLAGNASSTSAKGRKASKGKRSKDGHGNAADAAVPAAGVAYAAYTPIDESESGTTLLGATVKPAAGGSPDDAASESGTTLLGASAPSASTLNELVSEKAAAGVNPADAASESGTTLLGASAPSASTLDESVSGMSVAAKPVSGRFADMEEPASGKLPADVASESGTTLLGASAPSASSLGPDRGVSAVVEEIPAEESEAGTTLLGASAPSASALNESVPEKAAANADSDDAASESGTTLLGSKPKVTYSMELDEDGWNTTGFGQGAR